VYREVFCDVKNAISGTQILNISSLSTFFLICLGYFQVFTYSRNIPWFPIFIFQRQILEFATHRNNTGGLYTLVTMRGFCKLIMP
jgi:hypothetical protein